mmetsp:Transcript_4638/g.5038  ORF Transcript_4638/g.5038 Transcript_4638/m.5038 type:complete len:368 (+) Transcript_4638:161-1264(+)
MEKSAITTDDDEKLEGRTQHKVQAKQWFKGIGYPVDLAEIQDKGYGMVATRNISASQVIMQSEPMAHCPYQPRVNSVCAFCVRRFSQPTEDETSNKPNLTTHKPSRPVREASKKKKEVEDFADDDKRQCPKCEKVWYCSSECQEMDRKNHDNIECHALQGMDFEWIADYYQFCEDLITDLRLLIRAAAVRYNCIEESKKKNKKTNKFDSTYGQLISNRSCYTEEVLFSLRSVVQLVNYLLPPEGQVDEDLLLDVYCKHRVNMFGVWGAHNGECLAYGVYPTGSFYNHSCGPNTTFYRCSRERIPYLQFLSTERIHKGQEVAISYIDITDGVEERQKCLEEKYFFACSCARCIYQLSNIAEDGDTDDD